MTLADHFKQTDMMTADEARAFTEKHRPGEKAKQVFGRLVEEEKGHPGRMAALLDKEL